MEDHVEPPRGVEGDVAEDHASGRRFEVTDPAAVSPRSRAFEVTATAPLLGSRVGLSAGEAGRREARVLATAGIGVETFASGRTKGARRPLRVRPAGVELADDERDGAPAWLLRFALPAGAYATVLLAELLESPSCDTPGRARVEGR